MIAKGFTWAGFVLYTCVHLFDPVDYEVTGVQGRVITVPVQFRRLNSGVEQGLHPSPIDFPSDVHRSIHGYCGHQTGHSHMVPKNHVVVRLVHLDSLDVAH